MKTIVVWILVISSSSSYDAGVTIVDNIVSERACQVAARELGTRFDTKCVPVAKVDR